METGSTVNSSMPNFTVIGTSSCSFVAKYWKIYWILKFNILQRCHLHHALFFLRPLESAQQRVRCIVCTQCIRFRQFLCVDLDESGAVDEDLWTHANMRQRHQLSSVLQTTVVLLQCLYTCTRTPVNNIYMNTQLICHTSPYDWLWPPYGIWQAIIFSCCGFYLLLFFLA